MSEMSIEVHLFIFSLYVIMALWSLRMGPFVQFRHGEKVCAAGYLVLGIVSLLT